MKKIRLDSQEFKSLLRSGSLYAGLRNTMLVLKCVKVTTRGGRIKVESTDNDNFVCVYGRTIESDDTCFVVNAKNFASLVSLISDDEIELLYDDSKSKLVIKHSHGKASLPTESTDDYPTIKSIVPDGTVKMSGSLLSEWLGLASNFVETTFNGSALENVNVWADSMNIGVSSGTHSLIFSAKTKNVTDAPSFSICLTSTAAQILSKICALYDELSLSYNDRAVFLQTEDCKLYSSLVDIRYPDVSVIFSKVGECKLSVDRDVLLQSLRRISCQMVKESKSLSLTSTGTSLLMTYSDGLGFDKHAEEEVPCRGDAFSTVFVDASKFLKVVNTISSNEVYFSHADSPSAPLLFVNEYEDNKEMYLLAPMK